FLARMLQSLSIDVAVFLLSIAAAQTSAQFSQGRAAKNWRAAASIGFADLRPLHCCYNGGLPGVPREYSGFPEDGKCAAVRLPRIWYKGVGTLTYTIKSPAEFTGRRRMRS